VSRSIEEQGAIKEGCLQQMSVLIELEESSWRYLSHKTSKDHTDLMIIATYEPYTGE
jgi:hypothetical protein